MSHPTRPLLLCFLLSLSLPTVLASDWPTFMGSAARSGIPEVCAPSIDTTDLELTWTFDVHAEVVASPVARDDQVLIAAENGNLYSVDLQARQLQWVFSSTAGIGSTPAIADERIFFLNRDGYLQALNRREGKPLWRFQTGGEQRFSAYNLYGMETGKPEPDPWDFFLSSPLVKDGRVYFGSSDQRIYALDAETGELAWTFKTGGIVHSSPALGNDTLVVGSWDGAVYALDPETGAERWRFQTETEQQTSTWLGVQSSPVIRGDSVYVGSRDGYMYRLNLEDGKQRWRYDAEGSWVVATPAVDDKRVYFGTSDTALLVALDKSTGEEIYRFDTRVWAYASALRVGEELMLGTMRGDLLALDAATGELQWSYRTPASQEDAWNLIDPDTGSFRTEKLFGEPHQLYSAMAHVKRLGAFIASPIWHNNHLIAVTATGQMLVFQSEKTGDD